MNLINPCGNDGCESDVEITVDVRNSDKRLFFSPFHVPLLICNCRLLQGEDRRINTQVTYRNVGPEEARNFNISIYGFPANVLQQVLLELNVS